MAELVLVEELQDFLVAQGVAQLPGAPVSTTVPSIVLQPRDGVPEPRAGENVTITLIDTHLTPAPDLAAWIEETFVDIVIVSRTAAPGKLLHRAISRLLTDPNKPGGYKSMWTMGGLLVEYSTFWRGEQPLPPPDPTNVTSYRRVASYRFGARRKALAGLPTVP